ncbi:MAG: oxidase [Planctomycetaceae bacterium]|nr:oxidase [Planctomycetaceae bacterium]|tara:strand:+ start:2993 stop:5968 length:2976 start_codon:yes stop_codon:yes gene_type:complete
MDQEQARIKEDLSGLLAGDVLCDDLFLQLYASDASVYEIRPAAVVRPRHIRDVTACVQYAAEHSIPLHPRGAGTGLAGESLGPGIVIDFSRYMNRIGTVTKHTATVQPGVVHATLNDQLARQGRLFGPDPAMSAVTTMGSVLAIDASGSHFLQYGSARRYVRSIRVVLADGDVVDFSKEPLTRVADPQPRRRELVERVTGILQRDAEKIRQASRTSQLDRSGYQLHDLLSRDTIDMARLFVGSEGTLGLITEATLATEPLPAARGVVLLLYDRLVDAAHAVMDVRKEPISACDLIDRRHLSLARENDVRFDLLIPPETETVLLVEVQAESASTVNNRLEAIINRVKASKYPPIGARMTTDAEDVEIYWDLARKVVPTLYRLKGTSRPLPFIEDVAIDPGQLPDFFNHLFEILRRHGVTASIFAHAAHGQLHIRPLLDLASRADVEDMERIAREVYDEVLRRGGTISGEHGDGLSRSQFVSQQAGPLYETFREIKQIFDPQGILNPGKIISKGETLTRNLRPVGTVPIDTASDFPLAPTQEVLKGTGATVQLQLHWDAEGIAHAARNCNGCGACRSGSEDVRMCPIFRLSPREESSPRAKANLIRGVLTGRLTEEAIASEDFKEVVDLCVNCHQCRLDCPASVDIPKLMVEAKAAHLAVTGMRPSDWALARLDRFGALGTRIPRLANWALSNRVTRFFLEKSFSLAQGRKLPKFARQSFMKLAARKKWTRSHRVEGPKVLYFVDLFANYHDTGLAEATANVLMHNGVSVLVDPRQMQSGMAAVSLGAVDLAKRIARYNVEVLAERIHQGYTIITSEPSAASCLIHEYPSLLGGEEATLVAEHTQESCDYLWKMHQAGQMRLDLSPLATQLIYHQPCHLRSLEVGSPGENLLKLIPGISVKRSENGCSGMAGTYGLVRKNYRSSLRAGFDLISTLRDPQFHAGTTECSCCKIQMEQGTTKPTVHPMKLLAWSYGLMSGARNPLHQESGELTVS